MTGCERDGWHPVCDCPVIQRDPFGGLRFLTLNRPAYVVGEQVSHDHGITIPPVLTSSASHVALT